MQNSPYIYGTGGRTYASSPARFTSQALPAESPFWRELSDRQRALDALKRELEHVSPIKASHPLNHMQRVLDSAPPTQSPQKSPHTSPVFSSPSRQRAPTPPPMERPSAGIDSSFVSVISAMQEQSAQMARLIEGQQALYSAISDKQGMSRLDRIEAVVSALDARVSALEQAWGGSGQGHESG
ncbi:hypothetical protein J8273_0853 [Carpediemonas membranifera]|uniref:Uncharacterized protein n=1 Tax=Carpediemonas membranifera TaxID=201153 RepID=A0A8J6B7R3_9EUKA|nr:hypothetical protein J8273_0853 [Carpediemonas membranifera]|eukprot:KAG9397368.1 hypothetical protein J8273_0853 [Carpediemonas membranifera]